MNPWDWPELRPHFPIVPFLAFALVGAIIFVVLHG